MKVVKVTTKGQITIPVEVRNALSITGESYLEVRAEGDEIRIRRLVPIQPLNADDPIWELIGAGASGTVDTAGDHDRVLADAEVSQWRRSS